MTISLAFLSPDLVKAAIDGRLPHGMGVARLCDLPAEWPDSDEEEIAFSHGLGHALKGSQRAAVFSALPPDSDRRADILNQQILTPYLSIR